MMLNGSGRSYDNKTAGIILVAAALVLLANGIFDVQQFGVQYGLGVGAALESSAYNLSVVQSLQPTVIEVKAVYQAILESFMISGIGIVLFGLSLSLLLRNASMMDKYLDKYVPVHLVLLFVYLLLLVIMHITFGFGLYAAYAALGVCVVVDIYLALDARRSLDRKRESESIKIDPTTPYANLVAIRERLFGNLSGEVRIVDKHFNSNAISNLYRLFPSETKISKVSVITSEEMLDSKFGMNYSDLREELLNRGVEFEVRIMRREDSTEQHERFLFDDSLAYKIPPFNIINKKSEHILSMDHAEARKRFDYLYKGAAKLENFAEKKGRRQD